MEQTVFTHSAEQAEKERAYVHELVERIYANFRKQALSRLNYDEDAADEAIYDMYQTAVKKAHTLAGHPKPEAWLARVLQNCIKRQIKKLSNHPERKYTFIDIDSIADLLPDPKSVEDIALTDEEDIRAAKVEILSSLSETELMTYKMRYEENLSVRDIAEKMSVSQETVRIRLYRLREKIKAMANNIFS